MSDLTPVPGIALVRESWGSDVCLSCGCSLGTEETCVSCRLANVQARDYGTGELEVTAT